MKVANNKELEENATKILKEYKTSHDIIESHPQYDAMAVYHTSKMMKIKVNEEKLIDLSHLKRMQWTQLKTQWHRWLEDNKVNLKALPNKRKVDDGMGHFL